MENLQCVCGCEKFKEIDDGLYECIECGTVFVPEETRGLHVNVVKSAKTEPEAYKPPVAEQEVAPAPAASYTPQPLGEPEELVEIAAQHGYTINWDVANEVRYMLSEGQKLKALHFFRGECDYDNCNQLEAREMLDKYAHIPSEYEAVPSYAQGVYTEDNLEDPSDLQSDMSAQGYEIEWDDADEIRQLLIIGQKNLAAKRLDEISGCGLAKAKDFVEGYCGTSDHYDADGNFIEDEDEEEYDDEEDVVVRTEENTPDPVELQYISKNYGPELDWYDADKMRNLIIAGEPAEAVILFSELMDCSMEEATEAIIEYLSIDMPEDEDEDEEYCKPTSVRVGRFDMLPVQFEDVDRLLRGGNKLAAIKYLDDTYHCGLSLAKESIDMYVRDNNISTGYIPNDVKDQMKDVAGQAKDALNKAKSGCYVATCVYGSYDCPQVWTLRRYRDNQLHATWYGRLFIRAYYAVSPTIVKWFGQTKWFHKLWKGRLDKMVKNLQAQGVESTPYDDLY